MLKNTHDPNKSTDNKEETSPLLKEGKTLTFSMQSVQAVLAEIQPDVVVFALDYDGCADILTPYSPNFTKRKSEQKHISSESTFFHEHLKALAKNKITELYIGSARQDIRTDNLGEDTNLNGSCIANLFNLAGKYQWTFNELLLADITYADEKIAKINHGQGMRQRKHIPIESLPILHDDPSVNVKINTLVAQLYDINVRHAGKDVSYYFYDDDIGLSSEEHPSIFKAFKEYLSNNPDILPKNVKLYLMHYDHGMRIFQRQNGEEPAPELLYWSSLEHNTKRLDTSRITFKAE